MTGLTKAAAAVETAGFVRGTRLLTPNGYVPVEAFKPDDPVISRLGIRRAVRETGRRDVEIGLLTGQGARPVLILPGAMGPGLPGREIRLSPAQALFIDGALVPAICLVNGATIRREDRLGPVSYYQITLDRHDALMAEGLPVESWFGASAMPVAQLVTGGRVLARIRRRLQDIAGQSGGAKQAAPAGG